MSTSSDEDRAAARRAVYLILIAVATGGMLGRVLAVNSVDRISIEKRLQREGRRDWRQQRPFLSANDRSRWCTVRSLVEHGTYAIDDVVSEPNWDTIDMVAHPDREGRSRLYSSKPPLLSTLLAVPYWVIHRVSGATLASHPYQIGRLLLILVNVLPMVVYFLILARLIERYGSTDWGRMFVLACAAFGTFLTTFAVVLNNHSIAAVSAIVAVDAFIRIWYEGERRLRWFVVAGIFAAFTAANELPALALFALLSAALLWRFSRPALVAYLPAAALIAISFFGTNYVAHASLRPPYMHRSPGDDWYDYTYERNGRTIESYWRNPVGIDRGEASPAEYALHVLVGHHGVFSLTPVWLLSLLGLVLYVRPPRPTLGILAAIVAVTSIVCLAFYLSRPLVYRNYGGMTAGLRWMFWFAPLWLVVMLPAADRLASKRWLRVLGLLLLTLSLLSATYPTWNPWTHPWIYNAMSHLGWL